VSREVFGKGKISRKVIEERARDVKWKGEEGY
jgi:hypothetical protein